MIDITTWVEQFLRALDARFAGRTWFAGLQGSYGRGEATETSDIDLVVILDELTAADISTYNAMLDTLPHRELICGFLSGKEEILHWDAADLFQFYHDTTPIRGTLDSLLPLIDDAAVQRAIHMGACNIFHGCVHNMLYEKSEDILRGLYKAASFVVQAIAYLQTGTYFRRQVDLRKAVAPHEQGIIDAFLHLKSGGTVDFRPMSEALFTWAQHWINQ